MNFKRWILPSPQKDTAAALAEECGIHPFLALLLVIRGVDTSDKVLSFLGEDCAPLDPFSFTDMDIAVDRIGQALHAEESIVVYGDYDVDGITSTVLLFSYLRDAGANVTYRIPTRDGEGYGLHKPTIDEFAEQGVRLIITVDNGISAIDEIAYANERGIDVVVTDHHQPLPTLPPAVAVVNPHREDCILDFCDYAGVGVAFMLACALEGDEEALLDRYADLVALGTLADVMPLQAQNRHFVRLGLRMLNENIRLGLRSLAEIAGIADKQLNATSVAFGFAPRLNAAGRMASPDLAASLLLSDQEEEAHKLAKHIQELNTERQKVEAAILQEITLYLQENPALLTDRVLVLSGNGWHHGVIGIIAARIVERYGKPCIIVSVHDGIGKGSGRSLKGFSLFEAIRSSSAHLMGFGGHDLAAGITLAEENIDLFRQAMNQYASDNYAVMPTPELRLDCKLRPSQIDVEKLYLLSALEPFGTGNPPPIFGLYDMRLDNITPIGGGKHLRLSVSRDDVRLSVMKFHTTAADFPVECGSILHLAVTLEKNEYRGVISPSLILKDFHFADTNQEDVIQAFHTHDQVIHQTKPTFASIADCLPDREQIAVVYKYLRVSAAKQAWSGTLEQLWHRIGDGSLSFIRLRIILEVLCQGELISVFDNGDKLCVELIPVTGKVDLNQTPAMLFLHSHL